MILTINCGSSTIKYQLFNNEATQSVASGVVSRIGEADAYFQHQNQTQTVKEFRPVPDHNVAFQICIDNLLHPTYGAIDKIEAIEAVGHRAVHGADLFVDSTLIDAAVIAKLEACVPLAPLHNPANLIGIRGGMALLPNVPHVAVFDTAFNQTMPPKAYLYALPYELYEQHKIRKYGFHGTSVRYVSERAAVLLKRPLSALKMVVAHLGNGVTMTAVAHGQAVDTTIGLATFSGVMMGTRSGDIDPGLIFHLQRQLGMSLTEIETMLYKQSGLLGVSGLSNDMRTITEAAQAGNGRCQLALELFAYMATKYLGAFAAAMGGLDALVFTAGIGENSPEIRALICQNLAFLGLELDPAANEQAVGGQEVAINQPEGKTAVLVVPTNEEKMIALDTRRLISSKNQA